MTGNVAQTFLPPYTFRMHSSQVSDLGMLHIYKTTEKFLRYHICGIEFLLNVLFSSKVVKNHLIFNLSWGDVKALAARFHT